MFYSGKRKSHLFHGGSHRCNELCGGGLISVDGGWMDGGAVKRWPLRLKSTESSGPNDGDEIMT